MPFFKSSLLILIVFLSACAAVEQKLPVYSANTILVLPVKSLHKELITSEPAVDVALKKYLKKTSFNIVSLSDKQFEKANNLALEQSGSIYSPSVGDYVPLNTRLYAASMKQILAKQYTFDTLVLAKLLLRDAEIIEGSVEFDGVQRKLEYEGGSPQGLTPRNPRGLSIQLNAFAQGNNATQVVFGGISLPFVIQVKNNTPEFVIKKTFFNEKELREGVKISVKQLDAQLTFKK